MGKVRKLRVKRKSRLRGRIKTVKDFIYEDPKVILKEYTSYDIAYLQSRFRTTIKEQGSLLIKLTKFRRQLRARNKKIRELERKLLRG